MRSEISRAEKENKKAKGGCGGQVIELSIHKVTLQHSLHCSASNSKNHQMPPIKSVMAVVLVILRYCGMCGI